MKSIHVCPIYIPTKQGKKHQQKKKTKEHSETPRLVKTNCAENMKLPLSLDRNKHPSTAAISDIR
jgi:hypothetical protein